MVADPQLGESRPFGAQREVVAADPYSPGCAASDSKRAAVPAPRRTSGRSAAQAPTWIGPGSAHVGGRDVEQGPQKYRRPGSIVLAPFILSK